MTQTHLGPESLPAKEDSTLSPPLHNQQWLNCSESQLGTVFLLLSAAVCAQSGAQLIPAVPLVRKTATEVGFKLPVKLWLHQHHPQRIKASASCAVLTVAFSFGHVGDQFTLDDCLAGIDRRNLQQGDRHHVKEALKEHGCTPPRGQVRRNNVKVRLWTHYRAASAASPSARGHEAPQSAATAKGPGDLSHASPPFRERSEVQKTGKHQQSLPECAEKGEAPRQQPKPLVGSGFDVDSDNSKPETIPPINLDCPF